MSPNILVMPTTSGEVQRSFAVSWLISSCSYDAIMMIPEERDIWQQRRLTSGRIP